MHSIKIFFVVQPDLQSGCSRLFRQIANLPERRNLPERIDYNFISLRRSRFAVFSCFHGMCRANLPGFGGKSPDFY